MEAKNTLIDLDVKMDEMKKMLALAQKQNEQTVHNMKAALVSNNKDLLDSMSKEFGMKAGSNLRRELAAAEKHFNETLEHAKESHLYAEIKYACELSRLAMTQQVCPHELVCSITLCIMEEPVMLVQTGDTYERDAIVAALKARPNINPLTNLKFEGTPNYVPNNAVKKLIESWKLGVDGDYATLPPPPPSSSVRTAHIYVC
jgi:hypothetical protein